MTDSHLLLETRGVSKAFPGVVALTNVGFSLRRGEVHFLLGENGAGKSTLINIISGVVAPDEGEVLLEERPVRFASPRHAQRAGVRTIHQEFSLIPNLSVAENITIERPPRSFGPFVHPRRTRTRAAEILDELGVRIDTRRLVRDLRASEKQIVDIARALSEDAKVLVMDEPTSTLSANEIETLFAIIRRIKDGGIGVIYISHRLEELGAIGDRVTVLRDGTIQGTFDIDDDLDRATVVELMVGKHVADHYPKEPAAIGDQALAATGISRLPAFSDVSLSIRRGEIVGVTGVVGSGMEPLAYVLAGVAPPDSGDITVAGAPAKIESVAGAIAHGIGLIPGDRREMGLIIDLPVPHNITLASLDTLGRAGWIVPRTERSIFRDYVDRLSISVPGEATPTRNLSGGNQQKVVIAKWLARNVSILVCVEPTRGIDVGARVEIYRIFNRMTAEGKSVVLVSTDYSEVLGMSDRIYVVRNGRIAAEYDGAAVDRETVLHAVFGSTN